MRLPILPFLISFCSRRAGNGAAGAYRFGRVWDGAKTMTDAVIVVDGDASSRCPAGTPPPGMTVTDMRRFTALPGLIDLHTHITYYWDGKPGTRPLGQRRRPAVTVFLAQENAAARSKPVSRRCGTWVRRTRWTSRCAT